MQRGRTDIVKTELGDYRIRRASIKDLSKLAELKLGLDLSHKDYPIWPPECDPKEARRSMRKMLEKKGSLILVAESREREPVGMIALHIARRKTRHAGYRKIADIGLMFVKEDQRRKGIGRALVASCIDHLEKRRVQHITLRNVAFNEAGNEFWGSLGFGVLLYIRSAAIGDIKDNLRH
jgi:GNAT superfamily N-acetyltransferase